MKTLRRLLFFIFLGALSSPTNAQNQVKIDSLLNLLPANSDSLTSTIYSAIRVEYHYLDFEKSEFYAKKEFEFAEKSKIPSLIKLATVNVGNHYAAAGDENNTAEWYQRAIDGLDSKTEGPQIASILNTWGIMFCNKGYYEKGMLKFQEALDVVDVKWPEDPMKGECLLSLGMIHGSLKNYEISDDYLERAITFFDKAGNAPLLYETKMMLAVNQYENYQFLAAKDLLHEVLNFFEESGDQFNVSKTCSNLSAVYFDLDSLDKAEFYCQKGLKVAQEIGRDHLQLILYQRLGQVNFLKEKYNISIQFLKQALPLAVMIGDIREQSKGHDYLAMSYEKIGASQLAYSHLREHIALKDSILSEDKIYQMNEMEKKYESKRQEQEIIILEERAKRDSLEKKGLISGIIGLVVLLGVFIYAMILRIKKSKLSKEKLDQELAFKVKELDLKKQELTSKVLQLCRKNEFLKGLDKQVNDLKGDLKGKEKNQANKLSQQINRDIETDVEWDQFLKSFESVHPNFNKKLNAVHPDFTAGEIRMAYLLKMNLGTKEIASLLNITNEGVKKARQRMRKKMEIDSSVNLIEYFMKFENAAA